MKLYLNSLGLIPAVLLASSVASLGVGFQFFAQPQGNGANGVYYVTIEGEGDEWHIEVKGGEGETGKGAVDLVSLQLFSGENQGGIREKTHPSHPNTGFNSSNGGPYSDTSEWGSVPPQDSEFIEWSSQSPAKKIDPFGGNTFFGTFFMSVPAEDINSASIFLEDSANAQFWVGRANRATDGSLPDSGPGAMVTLGVLLAIMGIASSRKRP